LRERERAQACASRGRGRKRGKERIPSRLRAEHGAQRGAGSQDPEITI